jgi:hypothetical protein
MFKGKIYPNIEKLHINMAKYYVKAFQIHSAIQKSKMLINLLGADNKITDLDNFPPLVQLPISELHIAYNYTLHICRVQKIIHIFDIIENELIKEHTFLPSLEEINKLVDKTKKTIKDIEIMQFINTIELFLEKQQFQELQNLFSMD